MITKRIISGGLFLALLFFYQFSYPEQTTDQTIISEVETALRKLITMQKEIKDIHPFLNQLHPIAIVEDDHLYIFDFDQLSKKYQYQKKAPVPFPMPKGIRASFPLSSYGGKPSCVVTRDIFNSLNGYILIFHEFIHCIQANTCEYQLKKRLKVAQIAAKNKNYSWELNHPFPYRDSTFVTDYSHFLNALKNNNRKEVIEYRTRLKRNLNQVDFEYMVWQEWKEGFARLIENKIQSKYGIKENQYGKDKPYNRITFYYGGANFIKYIVLHENDLFLNIELLFNRMWKYTKSEEKGTASHDT